MPVGLAGEGSLPAGVDAGIGHGLLVGAGFPELDAHPELGGSPGAQRQSAQQQHREQDVPARLREVVIKYQPFLPQEAAMTESHGLLPQI